MAGQALWEQIDHVCRVCLGRVGARRADTGTVVRCWSCGAESIGEPSTICCCGIKRGKFDRIRCVRLERPIPGVAAEIVVTEVDESGGR
jgi:hypothetical protein